MAVKSLQGMAALLNTTGLPVAYHHFESETCPAPPYICYYCDGENSFFADGCNYAASLQISIGLYTALKEPRTEAIVEQALKKEGLTYTKQCYYIESEKIYETIYETEI